MKFDNDISYQIAPPSFSGTPMRNSDSANFSFMTDWSAENGAWLLLSSTAHSRARKVLTRCSPQPVVLMPTVKPDFSGRRRCRWRGRRERVWKPSAPPGRRRCCCCCCRRRRCPGACASSELEHLTWNGERRILIKAFLPSGTLVNVKKSFYPSFYGRDLAAVCNWGCWFDSSSRHYLNQESLPLLVSCWCTFGKNGLSTQQCYPGSLKHA